LRVAVDAMGGDKAPDEIVEGALRASNELGIDIILVGKEDVIAPLLSSKPSQRHIEIIHTPEIIAMDEHPATAVRKKKDSSIVRGLELLKEGKADAFVSAGNSGAVMAASLFVLGRCTGIDRPAIGTIIPGKEGPVLLIDAGANVDPEPVHLLQFAFMGSIYAREVMRIGNPKVGLLSNGEEETKGNKLTLQAHKLLKGSNLNFQGNVEGRDVTKGAVHVIVTDGFTGNVVLKTVEGVAEDLVSIIREEITSGILNKVGALILQGAFRKVAQKLDYAEYGGAPLLGVRGNVFIAHGRSNAKAIKNAIRLAHEAASHRIPKLISDNNIIVTGKEIFQQDL